MCAKIAFELTATMFQANEPCSKRGALQSMLEWLVGRELLPTGEMIGVLQQIERRESLGSTGICEGVAVPHARLNGISTPVLACARFQPPIDFDAIDGEPTDVILMYLLPWEQSPLEAKETLTASHRLLEHLVQHEFRERLRNAASAGDLEQTMRAVLG